MYFFIKMHDYSVFTLFKRSLSCVKVEMCIKSNNPIIEYRFCRTKWQQTRFISLRWYCLCYFQVEDWIHKFKLSSRVSTVHITSPWFSAYHSSACFSDWMTKCTFTSVKTYFSSRGGQRFH